MKLMESRLPQAFSRALLEEKGLDLSAEYTDMIFDVIFTGTANLLHNIKSMEKPTAFTFKKIDGSLAAAAMVQYFPNEDANNPGNWSLVWTFNESDIPENALVLDINSDLQSHAYFRSIGGEKYAMRFDMESDIVDLTVGALVQLKKWLDENAKEKEIVEITLDGVFEARVSVENGEKVFAIAADGEIKNLIKSDDVIEK